MALQGGLELDAGLGVAAVARSGGPDPLALASTAASGAWAAATGRRTHRSRSTSPAAAWCARARRRDGPIHGLRTYQHRLGGDRGDEACRLGRVHADQCAALPTRRHRHVAADQERQPAEQSSARSVAARLRRAHESDRPAARRATSCLPFEVARLQAALGRRAGGRETAPRGETERTRQSGVHEHLDRVDSIAFQLE